MVPDTQTMNSRRGLIVGNYCHDVLTKNGVVMAETLGGAASFISAVHDGLSVSSDYVSKVGSDFKYSDLLTHDPIVSLKSPTTLFRANFDSEELQIGRGDRVLKRVRACEPVHPSDLPVSNKYWFGLAVGVGGEVLPDTLERMLDMCDVVFVDIQALIRVFDDDHGGGVVNLVALKESGFFHLLPRIGFLKASAEEAVYLDVEEVRKWCCVVVTNGKDGCRVYWKENQIEIAPFRAIQVDPTGAGDSFLGGFVAGLVQGLSVPDAALLGNFFGSLTVAQIGYPKFDSSLLQRVKEEVQKRKIQCNSGFEKGCDYKLTKPLGHEQFHASLCAAKLSQPCSIQEFQKDLHNSPIALNQNFHPQYSGQHNFSLTNVYEEPIYAVEGSP